MAEQSKPQQVWGKRTAEFYADLKDEPILVAVSNEKVFKGQLIGVDVYDIIVQQESGLELLIPKGNIVYIHKARR